MGAARGARGLWLALGSAIGAAAALSGALPACSSGAAPEPPLQTAPHEAHSWTDCQASDQAFVRRALFALIGRRSLGQAEVNANEDIVRGIRSVDGSAPRPPGGDLENARRAIALAMMTEGAFRERWSDFFMDALRVARTETKSQASCYGDPNDAPDDGGALAAYVRDNDATASDPPAPAFTMRQLLASSIALDDLSPLYRAHLFAMMSRPLAAANVAPLDLERARRQDFGAAFEAAYLHRDMACLSCHNSEHSVTYSADPAKNRAWPVPGLFERALYGSSDGRHPPAEAAENGTDELRARSMFRSLDVADGPGPGPVGKAPYGWSSALCGAFKVPEADDPLGVDTYFGSVRSTPEAPLRGRRASVWDLERALRRGVDLLAAHGLQRLANKELADADEAFAYLVAENIAEEVWTEVIGTRLTIAHSFPRTEAQRDILTALTEHFIASHFSLKTLLLDIVAHPAFNLRAPDEGCGGAAYELPMIFDPWTAADSDLARRGNSPADGVFAISSRALRRSLHRAMEWPPAPSFPSDGEVTFQAAIGVFLKDGEPGFRGLDFQGRLAWEAAYGRCEAQGGADFISRLAARAAATPGATVKDALVGLKDRLVGEPSIDEAIERPALEGLLGVSLDTTSLTGLEALLRTACGAFVASPQFMLGGLPPPDTRAVPTLTPPDASYAAVCGSTAQRLMETGAPYEVTCGGEAVVVKR